MSRFVRPESVKLDLTDGDWLIVKRRLTAGEERHAFARILKQAAVGERMSLDFEQTGLAKIVAYLLDWSLADDTGAVVPIRDQPASDLDAALLNLDPASIAEIYAAVTDHEAAQLAALDAEKKTRATETPSSRTSIAAG
jgi:hypothetical protein